MGGGQLPNLALYRKRLRNNRGKIVWGGTPFPSAGEGLIQFMIS